MVSADDEGERLDWAAAVAEQKIQEAIEAGLFEGLPGAGQPLELSVNPFELPGMGAIHRLLKHNNALPPWVLLEKEIEAERAFALAATARWEQAAPDFLNTAEYPKLRAAARAAYEHHMRATNDLILKYNISNPFAFRALMPFMVTSRLREFDARYGTGLSDA